MKTSYVPLSSPTCYSHYQAIEVQINTTETRS